MWDIIRRFGRQRFRMPAAAFSQARSASELGIEGERLAVEYLKRQNYRIVVTNFLTPTGSDRRGRRITGEIDIIAYDESSTPFRLAFIEVKTRTSAEIASPESAVNPGKRRRIIRASRAYMRMLHVEKEPYGYDVLSIVLNKDGNPNIRLLKDYFSP